MSNGSTIGSNPVAPGSRFPSYRNAGSTIGSTTSSNGGSKAVAIGSNRGRMHHGAADPTLRVVGPCYLSLLHCIPGFRDRNVSKRHDD